MTEREKALCPACGAGMNLHAEKVVYEAREDGPPDSNAEPGGLLTQFHTCPDCGDTLALPEREGI